MNTQAKELEQGERSSLNQTDSSKGSASKVLRPTNWSNSNSSAFLAGLLEGTIVVVPMEPFYVPMMLSRHRSAFAVAALLTVGNTLGGLICYFLGGYLFAPLVEPLLEWMGLSENFAIISEDIRENAALTLFLVGVTPIPYQAGVAAAGMVGVPLLLFVSVIAAARGLRYALVALAISLLSPRIIHFLEQHQRTIFWTGIIIFLGFCLVAYF